MKKKIYMKPLIEVAEICVNGALMSSPIIPTDTPMPDPSHPGAPMRRTPVF